MDSDSDVEDFLDPIGKMFKEISVPDPFGLLDEPAKSIKVRDNLHFELDYRKRAIALILCDIGTYSKYFFILIVLLTLII